MSQAAPFPKEVKSWLKQAEDFRFEVRGTKVIAFPNVHLSEYDLFRQELKSCSCGRYYRRVERKRRDTGSFVGNEHTAEFMMVSLVLN